MDGIKLSACWITKNEEKNLARSLESVRNAVDELVVVDTGSTDGTVKLAEELGARVETFEWTGDFSAAKNYALSQTNGGIIVFLDADEWFEPALSKADHEEIESIFAGRGDLDALQLPIHNLNSQNGVKTVSIGDRIIRRKKGLGFQKRIHEQLLHDNGAAMTTFNTDRWKIFHSGYVEEIFEAKMRRNIEILEQAVVSADDAQERNLHYLYLVREYHQVKDMQNCAVNLKRFLSEPEIIRRQFIQYGQGLVALIYSGIVAAAEVRDQVSRREVYRKIIVPFQKYLENYSGAPTIKLYYDCLFDLKEEILLHEIGPALEAARRLPESPVSYFKNAEAGINSVAAEAELRRARLARALDYSIAGLQNNENLGTAPLRVLLNCLRGQPSEEIILFLNSQFNLNNPKKLGELVAATHMDSYREVHSYYLSKKIDAGMATKGDYLYFLLLLGKYEESVSAALEFNDDINGGVVRRHLLMAAVCSDNEGIYRDNAELLHNYSRMLDAYFAGTVIEQLNEFEIETLLGVHDVLAIAAGMERMDKFTRVFEAQSLLCFQLRTKYCAENGLYAAALQKISPKPDDLLSNRYITECLVMTGKYGEALDKIRMIFSRGKVDGIMLRFLRVVADCSTGVVKSGAEALYGQYMPLFDRFVDLTDVVRTGYVFDNIDKKKQKGMSSMTYAQFNKQLEEDAASPGFTGLPELCEQAGAVYEQQNMHAMALECYRFAVAKGMGGAREGLVRALKGVKNWQLAARLTNNNEQ